MYLTSLDWLDWLDWLTWLIDLIDLIGYIWVTLWVSELNYEIMFSSSTILMFFVFSTGNLLLNTNLQSWSWIVFLKLPPPTLPLHIHSEINLFLFYNQIGWNKEIIWSIFGQSFKYGTKMAKIRGSGPIFSHKKYCSNRSIFEIQFWNLLCMLYTYGPMIPQVVMAKITSSIIHIAVADS